ncbi:outer membrane beta-barrel protein [Flavihumibacter stibioxidans]|uniref:Outer membrane protein beta-barrel domain-containing protein n=1 Tax=Flavihumibacter stibioxidans TaxID=1834163 RepID=A0ABR7M381_9BACT|nr:outer membrane beta-barrel family protein [Flavihumibacter stibioxidans]MBC6489470.1 hypothetical protein [Flavihumibacter stibioxidans]
MRKLLNLIPCLLLAGNLFAQHSEISGMVADTSEKKPLVNAVVALLSKDSVLLKHTRTDEAGKFKISSAPGTPYILLVTYPKFADFMDVVKPESDFLDLGKINLIKKSVLLEEVIVSQKIGAIRVKGDTLEFRADSFAVREGANVEALLKKLPGLQVDKNGQITAQGETVQKILVDGEEFFSDDPAVVTQNLRADAVEKVQVFDKKSEQAAFTGIDDGEKMKTINLTLKEDKKKGAFGRVKLAGGLPRYYENEAMVNLFKGKRKMAVYGTMSNTGKAGLNWQDNQKFGGGDNMEFNEEEGYFYSYSESDEFNTWGGRFNGEGLPRAWTAGGHYSNKWDGDKKHLNSNYQFYKQNIENEGSTISQYILPDTLYYTNQFRRTFTQNQRNQLSGFYDLKLDSMSSVKVSVNGSLTDAANESSFRSSSLSEDQNPVNAQIRDLSSIGQREQWKTNAIWRQRFKKKGRTLSVTFEQQYNSEDRDGALLSINSFFNSKGENFSIDTVDQKKMNYSQSNILGGKISYTEPLSKKWFLETNYGYRVNNSKALRSSFNKAEDGKYSELDSLFSSDYAFNFNTHSGGMNFRFNGPVITASFGSNISSADFRQKDLRADTAYSYNFVNFFPRANIRFKLGAQRNLNFSYNGSTRQPALQQIQPVRENADPLNIQIGNPDLKQEFRHNFNFFASDYKVLSGRNIYINGGGNFVDNAISSGSFVDSVGRRLTQFVNMNGNLNYYAYTGYWKEFKKAKVNMNANLYYNGGKNNNLVNGIRNTNKYFNIGTNFSISHEKEKKYRFSADFGPSFTQSRSSIRPDVVTKYWTTTTELNGTVDLPWKMEIQSNLSYSWRQKTDVFGANRNVWLWNAHLGKKFWKNNAGEIRFSMNDILNQNIGFQRNASSNFITENTYQTLRRYWLLSFNWNFNKQPGTN